MSQVTFQPRLLRDINELKREPYPCIDLYPSDDLKEACLVISPKGKFRSSRTSHCLYRHKMHFSLCHMNQLAFRSVTDFNYPSRSTASSHENETHWVPTPRSTGINAVSGQPSQRV